ncbi:MAG: hypothetical protein MI919_08545 [Holophagales bacterium]|nr:hypothetical protein [Holophagales bacterium]
MTDKRKNGGPDLLTWFFLLAGLAVVLANSSIAHAGNWHIGNSSCGGTGTLSSMTSCVIAEHNTNECNPAGAGNTQRDSAYMDEGPTFVGLNSYSGDPAWKWDAVVACIRANGQTGWRDFGRPFFLFADGNECEANETFNSATGNCDSSTQCDESITGKVFLRPVFSGGSTGNICHESSQCTMTAQNVTGLSGGDLVEYVGTNQSCNAEPVENVDESNEQPQCITSGGNTWCTEPDLADQNCGMLNGEYVCLDSIPDGECTFFGNGNMACDSTASSPPAPDDGVSAGTPAPADISVNNNGNNVNVYGSGTVAGSTTPSSGTSQPDGTIGEDPDEQSGSATSSGSCDVPPSCSGDAIQCAILQQQWESSCQNPGTESEILADTGLTSFTDVDGNLGSTTDLDTALDDSGWLTTRECMLDVPVDFGYFGSYTLEFSQWCPLFAFAGVFVLISAGIGSLRIIAGAF